jgi:hypothetical protein
LIVTVIVLPSKFETPHPAIFDCVLNVTEFFVLKVKFVLVTTISELCAAGGVVGTAVGAAVGVAVATEVGAVVGAAVGAVVGAAVGALAGGAVGTGVGAAVGEATVPEQVPVASKWLQPYEPL